jgi:hypothetical protein
MAPMRAILLSVALCSAAGAQAAAAYDANGVELGASEKAVRERFPSAYCQPLQWSSGAADRRCDDSKVVMGGVAGRITFYLKQDRVQAFDVRFDPRDAERLAAFLKTRYGEPKGETRDRLEPRDKRAAGDKRGASELYKVAWEKGGERAVLTSQTEKRRGYLSVSRGDFEEEIYRVR